MVIKLKFYGILTMMLFIYSVLLAENDELKETRLKVNGEGDFALYSITSRMIGTAYLENTRYPDLFMLGDSRYGNICHRYTLDRFDEIGVPVFEKKEQVVLPERALGNCVLVQKDKNVYLFWTANGQMEYATFDKNKSAFEWKGSLALPEFESSPQQIAIDLTKNGSVRVVAAYTTKPSTRAPGNWRQADYFPYDAVGRWRGVLGYAGFFMFEYPQLLQGNPTHPIQISMKKEEILTSAQNIAFVSYPKGKSGVISGSRQGGIYFLKWGDDNKFEDKKHIVDLEGNGIRHPTIGASPILYPNEKGDYVDIIATGEGGAYYYQYSGMFSKRGEPIYKQAVPLKEKKPFLYGGSLCTPTIVDWDYDGVLDIVSGNSAGYILFFKNGGTNNSPAFHSGIPLMANGEIIHIQPGYGEDIQGPGEARWGYVGANVFDWNDDGVWDILTNDSRGRHTVFMGASKGILKSGKPLFLDDLNLHGTWRCRPGVGVLGKNHVYITLDDDDDVHLYFREDNYNLIDGGKLQLIDGKEIKANWLEAGGKGRLRFEITDWDGDGVKDLMLATNMHHSIPNPIDGIPWYRPQGLKGATLLFLKNVGTEEEPLFDYPKQLKYKNIYVRFGHHGCGASVGRLGPISDEMPNVIVCDEKGTFFLLPREHLSW